MKKFNLLCVAMLVALVAITVIPMVYAFRLGFKVGTSTAASNVKLEGTITPVTLMPKNAPVCFTHEIVNEKTGKVNNVQLTMAMVNSPEVEMNTLGGFSMGMTACGFLAMAVILAILVFFVKIILAVNRSEIFDRRMERRLGWCGGLLLVYYALQWVVAYAYYTHSTGLLEFADYEITLTDVPSSMTLLAGIGMLLIAQIFAIARGIKEEHELTI